MKILVVSTLLLAANLAAVESKSRPPKSTVALYNDEIDAYVAAGLYKKETLSTISNPDKENPILEYTFMEYPTGRRLPYRVKAKISQMHLQGINSRKTTKNDVDEEAKENCSKMDMILQAPNQNNDQYGHLIAYILGGPGKWYNVVPQTRRINLGTVTISDMNSPSVWARTEREIRQWVETGGYVKVDVLVAYDLKSSNRPTGFGIIEHYKNSPKDTDWTNKGYWFCNDPKEDPDVWNN